MKFKHFACAALGLAILSGCKSSPETKTSTGQVPAASNRVVLYCSVDEVYARPIIKQLEAQTGLRIDTVYDTEAAKTAGLAARIRAQRERTQGDVFWSSALLQTLLLKREGLLQAYASPSAKDVPAAFKDKAGFWTGMGVRARVMVVHSSVREQPRSLQDLLQPRFKGKVGISNPQFGTASDWVSALATRQGVDKTLGYFRQLKANGAKVLPGNSVVAERVARGELLAGVTDTDDFLAQQRKGGQIQMVPQGATTSAPVDAVMVPGSVAMLKGAPHSAAARKLIDAILQPKNEALLVQQMPGVYPLRTLQPGTDTRPAVTGDALLKSGTPADTDRWPAAWDKVREPLAQMLGAGP